MKHILAGCLVALCGFSSCANKEPDHDSSLTTPASSATAPAAAPAGSPIINKVDTAATATPGQVSVAPMPQQTVNQVTATTAPGMNPPHGQPNHRCDIAVGAPLNSPAAKPAVQTASPVVTQNAKATPKTVTAPGMNPPHGEPGHRCDIAVGAPLNSPVTKPATQTVAPVVAPAKKDSGS